jgi:hypothetical protein
MIYSDHFHLIDALIRHLDTILAELNDAFIESYFTGFFAVSSVTVLELSMKTIFLDFATAKHKILANFCNKYFKRINGRISLGDIQDNYLPYFGDKYEKRFKRELDILETRALRTSRTSIKSSYGNLLTWRHGFVHQGTIPSNASYSEVKDAFVCGKQIMDCLAACMHR